MTGKRKQKGKYKCWKKRKPMEAWERCNMDRKRTPVRNFGYWKEIFIDSQTLKYKIVLLSMRQKKKLVKNFSKQLTWFEHKLQIRKKRCWPPPPPPASTPSEASLCCLLGLTAKQHVDLLFDPVLVVRLVRLCVCTIPETARKIIFSFTVFFSNHNFVVSRYDGSCTCNIFSLRKKHWDTLFCPCLRSEVKFSYWERWNRSKALQQTGCLVSLMQM